MYSPPSDSFNRAVAAYQPYYEPPVSPQSENIRGSSIVFTDNPVAASAPTYGASVVQRKPIRKGERFIYGRGASRIRQFIMRATGAVQSSAFQPMTAHTWISTAYDAMYMAGYPGINLGISEKVPTIPAAALGTQQYQQIPRPHITRSIFTNRSFGTRSGLPAQPTNGTGVQ
jgi:hypothetical protein